MCHFFNLVLTSCAYTGTPDTFYIYFLWQSFSLFFFYCAELVE